MRYKKDPGVEMLKGMGTVLLVFIVGIWALMFYLHNCAPESELARILGQSKVHEETTE